MMRCTFLPELGVAIYALIIFAAVSCSNENGEPVSEALSATNKNWPDHFGFGYPARAEKIAAWDIDVRPDGKGLPGGSGNAHDGMKIYLAKCAACHGENGSGGPYSQLVSSDTSKQKTVGNYWPYATTLFDYIRRAMPFNAPGSLDDEEVYDLTAFILFKNKLVDSNMVINAANLAKIQMPGKKLFVPDDRRGGNEIR